MMLGQASRSSLTNYNRERERERERESYSSTDTSIAHKNGIEGEVMGIGRTRCVCTHMLNFN